MWEFIIGAAITVAAFVAGWLGNKSAAKDNAKETMEDAIRESAVATVETVAAIETVKAVTDGANAEEGLADLLNQMGKDK